MSWITIAMPALFGLVAVATYLGRRASMQAALGQYAGFVLSELAPRLGLRIVVGDPEANLLLPPQAMNREEYVDGRFEWHVRLDGAPRGRPVIVEHHEVREVDQRFTETRYCYRTHIHMSALTRYTGRAEITSRKATHGAPTRSLPLPLATFGDPLLDEELVLAAEDPRVGPTLRELIHEIDPGLRMHGLHLVIDEGVVSVRATRQNAMSVLYFAESSLPILESIAETLETA